MEEPKEEPVLNKNPFKKHIHPNKGKAGLLFIAVLVITILSEEWWTLAMVSDTILLLIRL